MITGYRKAEKILIEPYASYFHYLRDALFATPYWVVIGYGGLDFHANATIREAADFWGDRLRVFVINNLPEGVRAHGNDAADWMRRTLGPFGRSGRMPLSALQEAVPDDGVLWLTPRLAVSVDGRSEEHLPRVRRFLAS